MPIRAPAAIALARKIWRADPDATEEIIALTASLIVLDVKADELRQQLEIKETVLKLIGGNDGNRV